MYGRPFFKTNNDEARFGGTEVGIGCRRGANNRPQTGQRCHFCTGIVNVALRYFRWPPDVKTALLGWDAQVDVRVDGSPLRGFPVRTLCGSVVIAVRATCLRFSRDWTLNPKPETRLTCGRKRWIRRRRSGRLRKQPGASHATLSHLNYQP